MVKENQLYAKELEDLHSQSTKTQKQKKDLKHKLKRTQKNYENLYARQHLDKSKNERLDTRESKGLIAKSKKKRKKRQDQAVAELLEKN